MQRKDIKIEKTSRLVDVLSDNSFSYSNTQKLLRNKDVRVNGKVCRENVKVEIGDMVTVFYKDEQSSFEIVFEDDEVIIVNKFAGFLVVGEIDKKLGAFAVHRLDRNTEGLVVFAKTLSAKEKLEDAFKNHKIRKFYLTEVVGDFVADSLFKAYLLKDSEKAEVKVFKNQVKNSVEIKTYIKTLKHSKESSVLEVEIIGGKTHQIRAHLAFLNHAIIGDGKYGKREDLKRFKEKHQKLFAYKLIFGNVGIDNLNGREFKILPKWFKDTKIEI